MRHTIGLHGALMAVLSGHIILDKRNDNVTSIFPTNAYTECNNATTPKDLEHCKHTFQWRNGKFALAMAIVGLGFIFILAFTIMSSMRRAKARRLTQLYDSGRVMSQPSSGTMTPSLKKLAGNDLEIGCHHNVDLVTENLDTRGTEALRCARTMHPVPTTLDGANDRWMIWIREKGDNPVRTCLSNVRKSVSSCFIATNASTHLSSTSKLRTLAHIPRSTQIDTCYCSTSYQL